MRPKPLEGWFIVDIQIDQRIKNMAPGMALGVAVVEDVTIRLAVKELTVEFETVLNELQLRCNMETLSYEPNIGAVRGMYKQLKMDPGRYRPASEAMLRRVLQGKGLPSINTAVDVNNMGSLYWGIPSGIYNMDAIDGPITLRMGRAGETYEGIAGNTIDAMQKLVITDSCKIFGSPTTDSTSTKVDEQVRNLLLVQYIPSAWAGNAEDALAWTVDRLLRYNSGTVVAQKVIQ
jgi:DNA/RNA-binding domain of Phe-tRNA-synthetase-like protein